MKTYDYSAKVTTTDDKEDARRFRNILANSGEEMESGEVRDIVNLYVMGRDSNLIRIADLDQNPDEQEDEYKVNFAKNHGHYDAVTGERVVEVDDIIGDAKVWLESDGLHARVYFATDDDSADHAWAVSDHASYSIGTDWYENGYDGAGNSVRGTVGILREISMVDTGNDPHARTIDHQSSETEAQRSVDEAGELSTNERNEMSEIKDTLTAEEATALKETIADAVDAVAETAEEAPATDDVAEEPAPAEEKKDVLRSPVVVIRDRAVKQETVADKKSDARAKFMDALKKSNGKFTDDITGLGDPLGIETMFTEALENSAGIISYFANVNSKGLSNNVVDGDDRAHGHTKGATKEEQELTNAIRTVYCKMVYKKLSLDAMELYENPELVDFRARELVEMITKEIERAAIIGDGRESGAEDAMFDGTSRGFFSVAADASDADGYGSKVATSYTGGANLYEAVMGAKGEIRTDGDQILICKPEVLTAAYQAKVGDAYLITPGNTAESVFGVARVFTPQWMTEADADAYLLVKGAYALIGDGSISVKPYFDVSNNQDILLDETPRGGTLTKFRSAVAINLANEE